MSESSITQDATPSSSQLSSLTPETPPGTLPEHDAEKETRGTFNNNCQYILTCIGYAVGLGNIWRFPSRAYAHGGGAFLIPYVIVAFLFGLPTLFMEVTIGQFTQSGPSTAFKYYMPLAQGLGWAMSIISISIAIYYNVVVSWASLYIVTIVSGRMSDFTTCTNDFNTMFCDSSNDCDNGTVSFNHTCILVEERTALLNSTFADRRLVSASEEYFSINILNKHHSFEFGEFQWKVAVALIFNWFVTALGLIKGVKILGIISLVTATLPYVIIAILFGRGITLDGADIGISAYLTNPDFTKILEMETWKNALMQLCFSLSVGLGGLLAMSSYNRRSHNCFRDTMIIITADSFMSIFGGVAVFSTVGFLSKKLGRSLNETVEDPLSLAFVAYPEAINQMPLPELWSFLFFLMLYLLGISTMFGLVEGFVTCLCDYSSTLRTKHPLVVCLTSAVCCAIGVVLFCFQNGILFFTIFNEYLGSFALGLGIVIEILVITYCYGVRKFFRDVASMLGPPSNTFVRLFGSSGWLVKLTALFTAPLLAVYAAIALFYGAFTTTIAYEKWPFPTWAVTVGIILGALPLATIPVFALVNVRQFLAEGRPLRELFVPTEDHPAARYQLDKPPGLAEFFRNPLGTPDESAESDSIAA